MTLDTHQQLKVATYALWAATIVLFACGVIFDVEDLEHAAMLVGFAAGSCTVGVIVSRNVATSLRESTQVLVHLTALYNDDLLTPEGAELIGKLVPPRHAANVDGVAVQGPGVDGETSTVRKRDEDPR